MEVMTALASSGTRQMLRALCHKAPDTVRPCCCLPSRCFLLSDFLFFALMHAEVAEKYAVHSYNRSREQGIFLPG